MSTLDRPRRRLNLRDTKTGLAPLVAIGVGLIIWYVVALVLPRFPLPGDVVLDTIHILVNPDSYVDIGATLLRVVLGFAISAFVGVVGGVAMGLSDWFRSFFKPWVVACLSIPGVVAIIMAILVLGIGEASAMVALVVSVFPYALNVVLDAVRGLDAELREMSEVFGASRWQRWREVVLPQIVPALLASLRTAFALSWKLVVLIEALSVSRGIGVKMLQSFRVLDIGLGIAWVGIFTLFMWMVDAVLFGGAEKRVLRWRSRAEWR